MNLKAIFPSGATELTVNGLHQWDYGRKLDIHAPDLPALVEVHFACPGMDEAIVRVSSAVGGVTTVAIPDRCLEQSSPITAWVYEVGETSGQTIKTLTLNIKARTRPQAEGTIDPETSDKYTEAVGAMNEAIARMPEQFLPKTGGRIDGRLFVDGDTLEVGGIYGGKNSIQVAYLSGQVVGVLSLFGNGSLANEETDTNGIRGIYDHILQKNILEIGKDNKVNFNGEAETAKSAKTAGEANTAIYSKCLATDAMKKPDYTNITEQGLYCVVIKYEREGIDDSIYGTIMIYAAGARAQVYDPTSQYTLIYENNSFTLVTPNDGDVSHCIKTCYLLCTSRAVG